MFRKMRSWFGGLSKAGKTGVLLTTLFVVGVAASPTAKPSTPPRPAQPPVTQSAPQTKADTIVKQTVNATEVVPFDKTTVMDGTVGSGKTVLKTAGVNGVRTLTYEVTLENGVQTSKTLVSSQITTAPITEVTAIGTKITSPPPTPAPTAAVNCPNGTYVNTYGNTVCRPYQSPSAPAGATARCGDGSYSFSQSHSGTCSHHGGVAAWL